MESRKLKRYFYYFINIWYIANPVPKHNSTRYSIDYTIDSDFDFRSLRFRQPRSTEKNQFVAEVETDCELGKVEQMEERLKSYKKKLANGI